MYLKLLKVYLKDFSLDRLLQINGKRGKKIALTLVLIYALVVTIGGFGYMFYNLADQLNQANQIHILISFVAVYSLIIPIMMTLFRASGTLFFYKDYEIVAPLPIPSRTILAAKLTVMMIWMYISNLFFIVPILFSYFYFAGFDLIAFIIYLIVSIVFPMVPILLMSFVSLVIGFISQKFNFGKILQIVLLFAVFIGIMYLQFSINETTQNPLSGQIDIIAGIAKYYPPIQWFQDAIYTHDLLSLLYLVSSHLVLFVLFIFGVNKISSNINQRGMQKHITRKVRMTKVEQGSVVKTLIKKEFAKFFSIPIYVLNAGFGLVLLIILSVASLFTPDLTTILSTLDLLNIEPFVAISLIIGFVLALAYTPAISLSLEGKNLWVIKSLPIKAETVMKSKIYFNIILFYPVIALSIFLFSFSLTISFIQVLLLFLVSFTMLVLISYADALINLYFPKFNYKNEVEIVKQSLSAIIGMLAGMTVVFINGAIYYFLIKHISADLIFLLLSVMNILLTIPFYDMIKKKSEAIFQKL